MPDINFEQQEPEENANHNNAIVTTPTPQTDEAVRARSSRDVPHSTGKIMHWVHRVYNKYREKIAWVVAAIVVVSTNWAAAVIDTTLRVWGRGHLGTPDILGGIYLIVWCISAIFLYKLKTSFYRPVTRSLVTEPEITPRKHLVLFLSELRMGVEEEAGFIPSGLELTGDCREDRASIEAHKVATKRNWQWEMPLRAIWHHREILESLTIVSSRESLKQRDWFYKLIERYDFPHFEHEDTQFLVRVDGKPIIITDRDWATQGRNAEGFDFEGFDDLSDAMFHLFEEFRKHRKHESDIVIDFTGGQKVTSAVAVAMTFNRKIKAQYVQTNKPWHVKSYDVIMGSSETGGIGF
jgi:hypothetical protein